MAAEQAARSVGARVIGTEMIADALDRLERQVSVDTIMIELDGADIERCDALLQWVNSAAGMGAASTLISLPVALVDDVLARIDQSGVVMLCDPGLEERAATLSLMLAERRQTLHDHGVEEDAERLRRLSEEVARIAGVLAEISSSTRSMGHAALRVLPPLGDGPPDANIVRAMIRLRRLREQFFAKELFADPAWDMLLDLMAARLDNNRVAVSSLCIAASVPATTALRWIRTLTEYGLFIRKADPEDRRRIFIELADDTFEAMKAYFGALNQAGIRLA